MGTASWPTRWLPGPQRSLVTQAPTDPAVLGDVTVVLVEDALPALHAVAASWRGRFSPLTVGITGSVAKTSTKEATAAVLGRRFVTLRTPGNQNNEIGLPLTLLRLGPEHGAAVLEMGMYTGGEIADLARIARPSIGVVTAVREIHLARAGSLDAIEAAKAELVEALPADGVAVLNADDERVSRMAARTAARVVTYGFSPVADVTAGAIVGRGFAGMGFQLRALGDTRAVATPALGRHGVHNALAGAAVGLAAGLTLDEIADGLAAGWSAEHRSQLVRVGEVAVIDDTYNASPPSMLAALDLLATLPGRRLAVLGEMLELGELSEAGHREVGGRAGRVVDALIVVGEGASGIADAALEAGLAPERVPSRGGPRGCPPDARRRAAAGRRGPGQGLAGGLARPARGRPRRRAPVVTIQLIQGLVLSFALVVILMPSYIRLLQAIGFGKHVRTEDEGPHTHLVKEGTPTMGGLLIIAVVLLLASLLGAIDPSTYPSLAALAGVGALGAVDDYLNARRGVGIRVRQKLVWQTVVAFAAAIYIQNHFELTGFRVPFVGDVIVGPWPWILLATFAIVGSTNGVNLTDGLDGLAGGTLVFAFVSFMIIALLNVPTQANLGLVCALLIGGLTGFLWYNVHPASIFMGDAGALSFGAALAVTALITGQVVILPLIGIVYVVETLSDVIQVASFRLTGRRVFLMAPIHHHFELLGMPEEKITLRIWIVSALAGLLGVTLFLASINAIA